ncbi:hypothetical protein ATO7_02840 [Oceanococcus atlanticus]|uniref:Abasic site processing protein n=1 Tax=Oceanococcus atlanticus TaxID=1317117 RepID=A0A1Y1SGJ4_9GAMM|nr:SOS response-associated peptidase family protein [Oceanococcus atlanticus]ORE88777.1 hypothetical protein ATO7_02840 [Oceanococcus atlanticus]
MCFSAQVSADLSELQEHFEAQIDYQVFADILEQRLTNSAIKIPKALEANFMEPSTGIEEHIASLIQQHRKAETSRLEAVLFKQTKRRADAERKLQIKETKTARESLRIATKKIKWAKGKLADLVRNTLEPKDSRIFPFQYAAVVVRENGQNWIRPMRYHCRPAGKPASYDRRYDGLYNARRDNLTGFWKGQFGHSHGLIRITAFYENVARHDFENRDLKPGEKPENMVLAFHSEVEAMTVACLWSRWEKPDQPSLTSFAAITDEPPPEVAATGHDRCVIVLTEQAAGDWLEPGQATLEDLDAVLNDRPSLYYRHKIAA